MKGLRLPRTDWPLIIGGALLTVLAYPPFHLVLPSLVCLVPAVWLILGAGDDPRPMRRRLVQGFWFGLLSYGLVLYWMVFALWHFTPLSALGYAATITVLALWTAALFAVTGWIVTVKPWSIVWVFPVLWTAVEWLIHHQGDIRFPWLGLGTSLTGFPVLVQLADVVGARGFTLLIVLANAALALAWIKRSDRRYLARVGLGIVGALVVTLGYAGHRRATLPVRPLGRVAVLQPSEHEKWNRTRAGQDSIMQRLIGLSAAAVRETRPDLVAWPEAAVPDFFLRRPEWEVALSEQARESAVPMVVGGLDAQLIGGEYQHYNAAFFFDSTGRNDALPTYHKRFLVPIVERVPFVNPRWFSGLKFFGGFGVGQPGPLYPSRLGSFGIMICYESAFEGLTRDYRKRGADFVVNITNDSWFGRTAAPYQHAAHLVMRAIENRVGVARAANNGISEFVDPFGRVYHATRLDDTTFVTDTVFTTDARTIYTRLGDWVGLLTLVGAAVLIGVAWLKKGTRDA